MEVDDGRQLVGGAVEAARGGRELAAGGVLFHLHRRAGGCMRVPCIAMPCTSREADVCGCAVCRGGKKVHFDALYAGGEEGAL